MSDDRLSVFRDDEQNTEEETPASRRRISSGRNILTDVPSFSWTVRGLLPSNMVTGIYGPPGSGKSFYALALGLELARGGFWSGQRIEHPVPVLYVAAERPTDIRTRLEAWEKYHGKEIPDTFHVWWQGFDIHLATPGAGSAILDEMRNVGARVVILDTFARLTVGLDENSSKDVGPVMENLERLAQTVEGGSVIFVHHSGKNILAGMRGSSVILGAVSSEIQISNNDGSVTAKVTKSNVGPDGTKDTYLLERVELDEQPGDLTLRSSAVLVPGSVPTTRSEDLDLIVELLTVNLNGRGTRKQITTALSEQTGRDPGESTVGAWLTQLGKEGRLQRMSGGRSSYWILSETASEENLDL